MFCHSSTCLAHSPCRVVNWFSPGCVTSPLPTIHCGSIFFKHVTVKGCNYFGMLMWQGLAVNFVPSPGKLSRISGFFFCAANNPENNVRHTHVLSIVFGLQVLWEIGRTLLIYVPYFDYLNWLCSSLLLACPASSLVRNRRTKQTSRSFRDGSRIAPPITDLASSLHILSAVSVYCGSLRLPRPPFFPLTWHAHPLKSLLIGASPGLAVNCKRQPFSSTRLRKPMLPVCQDRGTKKLRFKSRLQRKTKVNLESVRCQMDSMLEFDVETTYWCRVYVVYLSPREGEGDAVIVMSLPLQLLNILTNFSKLGMPLENCIGYLCSL